jgi:hypothetical protein
MIPYINDVPVKGPKLTYLKIDGTFDTIRENPGIHQFIWEYFENLN